jgi:hypothetical protein
MFIGHFFILWAAWFDRHREAKPPPSLDDPGGSW